MYFHVLLLPLSICFGHAAIPGHKTVLEAINRPIYKFASRENGIPDDISTALDNVQLRPQIFSYLKDTVYCKADLREREGWRENQ
ncbi:hypothetical protein C0J52_26849 [Blattella germanica]|nr:hypothetical protein C0J52_26849 [Blattella germanica]